jgi:poly(A) polymerase
VDRLSAMVALEQTMGLPADPLRRLAALTGAPASALLKARLKLSNRDDDHLKSLGILADRADLVVRREFGQALYGAEPAWVRDAAMLAHVENDAPDTATLSELSRFIADWSEPKFPLTGVDLKQAGFTAGPDMGRLLAELERWWIEADFAPDRAACLAKLRD